MAPGYKRTSMIYLFDFGLARFIYTDETKKKLREKRAKVCKFNFLFSFTYISHLFKVNFRGTHRYCSYNAHRADQGRVDDLWSVMVSPNVGLI